VAAIPCYPTTPLWSGGWVEKRSQKIENHYYFKAEGENQLFKETRFAPQNKRSKMPEKNNQPKEV